MKPNKHKIAAKKLTLKIREAKAALKLMEKDLKKLKKEALKAPVKAKPAVKAKATVTRKKKAVVRRPRVTAKPVESTQA